MVARVPRSRPLGEALTWSVLRIKQPASARPVLNESGMMGPAPLRVHPVRVNDAK
jgi:hypothetical protein